MNELKTAINNQLEIKKIIELLDLDTKKLNLKKILITGSFGFIGKYILDTLINLRDLNNLNIEIFAIDNFITTEKEHFNYYKMQRINCINHDISKKINLDLNFDLIISLAGIASPYYYKKYPLETLNTSIAGLQNIFSMNNHKQTKYIFFSSSEIYGDPPDSQIPTSEEYRGNVTSIGPRACYDESKRLGETICYIYSTKFNKEVSIIRPFNVYGPGMNINDYRIIPNITRSVITNKQLKVYDTGNQTRTYCFIIDAIVGFFKVFFKEEKFNVYNIGNDKEEISVNDLLKISEKVINQKINYKLSPYPEEYPADQPNRRCPNINKAKKNLGYYPKINLEQGLRLHFNWTKKNLT